MGSNCCLCEPATLSQDKSQQISYPTPLKSPTPRSSIKQKIVEKEKGVQFEKKEQLEMEKEKKKKVKIIIPHETVQNRDNVKYGDEKIKDQHRILINQTLRNHFIFCQFDEKSISYIIDNMQYCTADSGHYIFQKNDLSFSFYIILEGCCNVYIDNKWVRQLTIEDFFGDLGLIYHAARSASIEAKSNCLLASLNRKVLKQLREEIMVENQNQNTKFLQNLDFYQALSERQKKSLKNDCLDEVYESEEVIYRKGDDANSFYILKQGVVEVKETNQLLHKFEYFGKSAIFKDLNAVRLQTLVASTKCRLLSISKEVIKKNMGDTVFMYMRKKQARQIIEKSQLYKLASSENWADAINEMNFIELKKGKKVLKKNNLLPSGYAYVLMGMDLVNKNQLFYENKSIIEMQRIIKNEKVCFESHCFANSDGIMGRVKIPVEKQVSKNEDEKAIDVNNVYVIKKMGENGKIYACYDFHTKQKYAVKLVEKEKANKVEPDNCIMKQAKNSRIIPPHPFLIKYYTEVKHEQFFYFITQLIEGEDLFDLIRIFRKAESALSQSLTSFYIMQLVLVLQHLHSNKIVYRKLNPSNTLINSNGYLTLIDLGGAKKLCLENHFRTDTIVGTPHYMAPQIIAGNGYSFQIDLWSLGIVMYELVCGKVPFGDEKDEPYEIFQQILRHEFKEPEHISKNCRQLLNQLLSNKYQNRLRNGFKELKRHKFFRYYSWEKIFSQEIEAEYKPVGEVIKERDVEGCDKRYKKVETYLKGER